MTPDSELLATFARTNSEDAFAEVVERHVGLVYSAALRQTNGDAHLAKDVAQTVFTDLAKKAAQLSRRENVSGWLYTSAHFAASKIVRTENRRRDREEKFMREPTNDSAPAAEWENLSYTLAAAMHELKEADRDAILLRYFENRPFAEVGAKLGLNENAARMRVERALEKLRAVFAKRGIATTAGFAAAISANAIQVAPVGLATTLTTTAIASVGAGTFTLLKMMTATKIKLGLAALIVAGGATALVLHQQAQEKLRGDNAALQTQIAQLQADNQSLSNRLAATGDSKKLSDDQFNELLKLRGEVGVLRRQTSELENLRDENQQLHEEEARLRGSIESTGMSLVQAKFNANQVYVVNAMKQLGLAERIYAGDNNDLYATNFDQMTNELGPLYTNSVLAGIEFVNVGIVNEQYPQMILFREHNPRQTPDGKEWKRIYGLADGSVQTATSSDGNFGAWEKYDYNLKGTVFLPTQYPSQ